jgi:hypothetical protein
MQGTVPHVRAKPDAAVLPPLTAWATCTKRLFSITDYAVDVPIWRRSIVHARSSGVGLRVMSQSRQVCGCIAAD